MLTTTATFDKFRKRPNARSALLVHAVGASPSTDFYWSDSRVDLTVDGNVYLPLIADWGTAKQKIDLFTKKSNIGNVTLTLRNTPYKKDDTGDINISDELFVPNIVNQSIKLYLWFEGITQLSDCLQFYDGYIQPPIATPEFIKIPIRDASLKFHKTIPPTILAEGSDDTTDLPRSSYGQPLSLGYGTFGMPEGYIGNAIEGRWTAHNKVVFTDHVMNALSEVWFIDPALNIPAKLSSASYSTTLDDSGQTTITLDDDFINVEAEAFLYPNIASRDFDGLHLFDGYSNLNNCFDQNPDTFMAGIIGDSSAKAAGSFFGYIDSGIDEAGAIQEMFLECKFKVVDPTLPTGAASRILYQAGGSAPSIDMYDTFGQATSGGNDTLTDSGQTWGTNEWAGFTVEIMFGLGQGQKREILSNTATELTVDTNWGQNPDATSEYTIFGLLRSLDISGYQVSNMPTWAEIPDGGANYFDVLHQGPVQGADRDFIEFEFVRLRVVYRTSIGFTKFRAPISNSRIYCNGSGRKFGSWIDGGGRSNSFDEGDAITNPAFIIESILRDELGLTTSLINEASFDFVAGDLASCTGAISRSKLENSIKIITDLCKQFKMNFFFDPSGKAKVITIDNSPSKDDDLLARDIIPESFSLGKGNMKYLVNLMRVPYFRNFFDEQTSRFVTASDSTSITEYNITNIFEVKAPYVTTTVVANLLMNHYRNTFWKDLHETMSIKLLTWEHVDWELGDIIEPDATLNTYLKKYNVSWGSVSNSPFLMVIEKKINKDGLEMKLMQVGDSGA